MEFRSQELGYTNGDDAKKEKGSLSRIGMWRINELARILRSAFDALAVVGFLRTTEGLTGSILDRRSVKS